VAGALHGTQAGTVLADPAESRLANKRGEGHGLATGVSEARWHREHAEEETPRDNPELPAEADPAS
jgi:hypothetical protein